VPLIGNGWSYSWDEVSQVPYLINSSATQLITFDDTLSVRLKCDYAREKNLAGVMFWALGHDLIGDHQPLLTMVGRSMGLTTWVPAFPTERPTTFVVLDNYPNPFNQHIARETVVKLEVFDLTGRRISILVNEQQAIGWHAVRFAARNLASGEYFYRLSGAKFSETGKMLLVN